MYKDFAKSYEQHSWEYAVCEYFRMKAWLNRETSRSMTDYAKARISDLEAKYPQLKQ